MIKLEKTILQSGHLIYGGDKVAEIPQHIKDNFEDGDLIKVVEKTGEVLHIPKSVSDLTNKAVDRAVDAFQAMGSVTNDQISQFYKEFAKRLTDDEVWNRVKEANQHDMKRAKNLGRSTTRLEANDKLRQGMIEGLHDQLNSAGGRQEVVQSIQHEGWKVDLIKSELGVIGFVFEGRPNVLADATGVLRSGNAVVFRIGSDALTTSKAIMEYALIPALEKAGIPSGAVSLVESLERSSAWSLFTNKKLSLAVARGSGRAVDTLGSLAQQSGIAVSLHGTGGAWVVAENDADQDRFYEVVKHSLDRKVCNTLNVCCLLKETAATFLPILFKGLQDAADSRGQQFKCHIVEGDEHYFSEELRNKDVVIQRADGQFTEKQIETLSEKELATEWEWEESPEITVKICDDLDHAIKLYNHYSPQFVASLISEEVSKHDYFFNHVNAPFVGNGFTRWVDGQYALNCPELGLSNWENGRMLARGAILNGESVFTLRVKMSQEDNALHR